VFSSGVFLNEVFRRFYSLPDSGACLVDDITCYASDALSK